MQQPTNLYLLNSLLHLNNNNKNTNQTKTVESTNEADSPSNYSLSSSSSLFIPTTTTTSTPNKEDTNDPNKVVETNLKNIFLKPPVSSFNYYAMHVVPINPSSPITPNHSLFHSLNSSLKHEQWSSTFTPHSSTLSSFNHSFLKKPFPCSFPPLFFETKTKTEVVPEISFLTCVPERVLDASGFIPNQHIQYLAWSEKNVLAIALENKVYTWIDGQVECIPLPSSSSSSSRCSSFPTAIAFSNSGTDLSIGTHSGVVYIYDLEHGKVKHSYQPKPSSSISSLAWSPLASTSPSLLAGGQVKGQVWMWDTRLQYPELLTQLSDVCQHLAWNAHGTQFASLSHHLTLFEKHQWHRPQPCYDLLAHSFAWSPLYTNLLVSHNDDSLHLNLWDMKSFQLIQSTTSSTCLSSTVNPNSFTFEKKRYTSRLFFDPHPSFPSKLSNQTLYLIHSNPCFLDLRDLPLLNSQWQGPLLSSTVLIDACIQPQGEYLATLTKDQNLKLWRLKKNTSCTQLKKEAKAKAMHTTVFHHSKKATIVNTSIPLLNWNKNKKRSSISSFSSSWLRLNKKLDQQGSKLHKKEAIQHGSSSSFSPSSLSSSSSVLFHVNHPYPIR